MPSRAECRPSRLLAAARVAGLGLSIVGVAFLGYAAWKQDAARVLLALPLGVAALSIAAYSIATTGLAVAWISITHDQMSSVGRRRQLIWFYARSVLAKYLPGNVFQLASRQIDLASLGYSQRSIAAGSGKELAGMITAASAVSLVGLTLSGSAGPTMRSLSHELLPFWSGQLAGWWLLPVVGLPLLGALLYWRWLALHLSFFVILEGIGWAVLAAASPTPLQSPPLGVCSLSWLAGFLAVGAPGGLGVREAAMIALLKDQMPMPALIAATVALRAITILGDALFAAVAALARPAQSRGAH